MKFFAVLLLAFAAASATTMEAYKYTNRNGDQCVCVAPPPELEEPGIMIAFFMKYFKILFFMFFFVLFFSF